MDSSQIRDRFNHHSQISHFIPQEPEGIISSNALLFHIVNLADGDKRSC